MKILVLDQFSEPGGAQLCIRDLIQDWHRRGWHTTFLAPGDGEMHEEFEEMGVATARLPLSVYANGRKTASDLWRYPIDMARVSLRMRWIASRETPDLVYINGPRLLPAALAFRCPVVFHAHSYLNKRYSQVVARECIRRRNAAVIAACHFAARPFLSDRRNVRVVYSGVRDQGFAFRGSTERFRVGIIGRIAPEKGQLDFIRAARLIAASRKDIEFRIYGSALLSAAGYEESLRAAAIGIPVKFMGWSHDVSRALHELDVLAVPSRAIDAAPRVVMEALSAGTPVVAYRSGGIPELVDHERTGLLTASAEPESLAASVERLLARPELRAGLAGAGRREWELRFRVERYQEEVSQFLEGMVGGGVAGYDVIEGTQLKPHVRRG